MRQVNRASGDSYTSILLIPQTETSHTRAGTKELVLVEVEHNEIWTKENLTRLPIKFSNISQNLPCILEIIELNKW